MQLFRGEGIMKLDLRCDVTALGRSISSFAIVLAVYLSMAASASAVTFNPTPPQSYDFGDVLIGDTATISYSASWYYSSGESGGSAVALDRPPLTEPLAMLV